MTYEHAASIVDSARIPEDIFGYNSNDEDARHTYRKLARAVHPDSVTPIRRIQAEALFAKLSRLWRERVGAGNPDGRFTIATKKRNYVATRSIFQSEIAITYPCVWMEDDEEQHGMMKMPRNPKDSDLMAAEAESLKKLSQGDVTYHAYVPTFVESFRHRDKTTKKERRVNVTKGRPLGWYSLDQVLDAYPLGLDGRDAAWMWRRLLTALGYAHQCEVVHGAVLPENILIHPQAHGLTLINWCYSVPMKTPLRAIMESNRGMYPEEVFAKEPATEATDIYMATLTMDHLLSLTAPRQMRSFVKGCTLGAESMRPHNAWRLLAEYDDLIERLYGPRKYRAFSMPA